MSLKSRSRICRPKSWSSRTAPRNRHSISSSDARGFSLTMRRHSCSGVVSMFSTYQSHGRTRLGGRQRLLMICSRNRNNPRPNRDAHAEMKSTTIAISAMSSAIFSAEWANRTQLQQMRRSRLVIWSRFLGNRRQRSIMTPVLLASANPSGATRSTRFKN
jgi:hypothetical protein